MNFDQLTSLAKEAAREAGLAETCYNPFKSIIVRGVEVVFAFEEALRIIDEYEEPDHPYEKVEPRAGTGYTIDDSGTIQDAKIVSPTAVNQKTIERDLWHFVESNLDLPDEELQWQCEQAVRNYDPCISCSAHFLKLEVERT
jgi:coenzyme F420-reducing hydrogenase alpha subunit